MSEEMPPTFSVHGAERDPDGIVPPRIGPIGIVASVALIALAYRYGQPHERLLKLLTAAVISIAVHTAGFVIAGYAAKLRIQRIAFLYGGAILRFRVGETWVAIGWIPLGGSVKFAGFGEQRDPFPPSDVKKTWTDLPPIVRTAIVLSGSLLLLSLSCVLIGPRSALENGGELPKQCVEAASGGYPRMLRIFYEYVDASGVWLVVGIVSAKFAAFNLLPLPPLNGGQALLEWLPTQTDRPTLQRVQTSVQLLIVMVIFVFMVFTAIVAMRVWRDPAVAVWPELFSDFGRIATL